MLAQITPADEPRVGYVNPCAKLQVDLFAEVDGTGEIDNGLGFGQGSTAGVLHKDLPCSGFQRIEMKPTSCENRKKFNFHRLCSSPYALHYDNSTICPDESEPVEVKASRTELKFKSQKVGPPAWLAIFIILILFLLAKFSRS